MTKAEEKNGADNGTRTRGLNLGKVALYQLSYVRNATLLSNVSAEARVTTIPEIFSNASFASFGVSLGVSYIHSNCIKIAALRKQF